MYLRKKDARTLLKQLDNAVRKDIKDSVKILGALAEESDWTFIVKSHSLVESLINELLISKISKTELEKTIQLLPLHDSKTSKIDILKSYNLLDKEAYFFLRKFSELRNNITHSFDNVDFDFSKHYSQLDKNQRKTWLRTVTWYADDNDTRQLWSDVLDKKSKYAFWMALQSLLFSIYFEINLAKGKNEIDAIAEKSTKELLENLL